MDHINRLKSEISRVMVGMDHEVELLTIRL